MRNSRTQKSPIDVPVKPQLTNPPTHKPTSSSTLQRPKPLAHQPTNQRTYQLNQPTRSPIRLPVSMTSSPLNPQSHHPTSPPTLDLINPLTHQPTKHPTYSVTTHQFTYSPTARSIPYTCQATDHPQSHHPTSPPTLNITNPLTNSPTYQTPDLSSYNLRIHLLTYRPKHSVHLPGN